MPGIEPGLCSWKPPILQLDDMGVKNQGVKECRGVNSIVTDKVVTHELRTSKFRHWVDSNHRPFDQKPKALPLRHGGLIFI